MKPTLALAAALAAAITLPAMALSWDQISGDWKQFEGKVQKQWGKLTNDDLQQAKGECVRDMGKPFLDATVSEAEPELGSAHGRFAAVSQRCRSTFTIC